MFHSAGKQVYGRCDAADEVFRLFSHIICDHFHKPVFAELLLPGVLGFGDSVGVEQQLVSFQHPEMTAFVSVVLNYSDRDVGIKFQIVAALRTDCQRSSVTRVAQFQAAVHKVQYADYQGLKHIGAVVVA